MLATDNGSIRVSGNSEKGAITMTFLTLAAVDSSAARDNKVRGESHGWFGRLCRAYAVAQMREAEREIRRFRHLQAVTWSPDEEAR
jgi:hypothetical protein